MVSLFTREWIEINLWERTLYTVKVSLFTREWIEIARHCPPLKSTAVSLFTREWIEIPREMRKEVKSWSLPLYEGVD